MENFRIESLEINKIGAFEHIKMDFPKKTDPDKAEIHILTGENGTGKSTVLEVLVESIVYATSGKDLSFYKKSHFNVGQFAVKFENHKTSEFIFHGGYFPPLGSIPKFIDDYRIAYSPSLTHTTPYTPLSEFEVAFFAYSGYRRVSEVKIIGPKEITDTPLMSSLDFNKSINPENLIQWIVNTITRELNAKGRGDNEKAKSFKKSLNILENIIIGITGKQISFDVNDDFDVLVIIDEFYLHFDVLPDGLKSMISWIGDLLMRMDRIKWKDDLPIFDRNFILFLDEIEVHLHPAWQRKILPVVQKLFKNAQIFISTHSPFVVGSVDGAWVHKLKKEGAFAVLDGEPTPSEDGKSVRRILDETFGINEQYGVDVEKDLEKFREFRQKIMMGYEYNSEEFNQLVKHLASQSPELEQTMGMEMNQLKRITQKELV